MFASGLTLAPRFKNIETTSREPDMTAVDNRDLFSAVGLGSLRVKVAGGDSFFNRVLQHDGVVRCPLDRCWLHDPRVRNDFKCTFSIPDFKRIPHWRSSVGIPRIGVTSILEQHFCNNSCICLIIRVPTSYSNAQVHFDP